MTKKLTRIPNEEIEKIEDTLAEMNRNAISITPYDVVKAGADAQLAHCQKEHDQAVKEERQALIAKILWRINEREQVVAAPCIFCGYDGGGYWQDHTHSKDCPFYEIGGVMERIKALKRCESPEGIKEEK